MKKAITMVIILFLSLAFISIVWFIKNDNDTLQYTQLTSDQQNELSKEINTIMGGRCEIISIQKDRIGGQAQVTYYYIALKCDSINTLLPMEPNRNGSGYYFDGDNVVVRVRDNGTKEDKTNLVDCLDKIFYKYRT